MRGEPVKMSYDQWREEENWEEELKDWDLRLESNADEEEYEKNKGDEKVCEKIVEN